MININDTKLYKKCVKKQAEMWLCKPPIGTIIINKFGQAEALRYLQQYIPQLRQRCFLYADEAKQLQQRNPQIYNFIAKNCYITNEAVSMVLCGTEGELWVTSLRVILNSYDMYANEVWVSIDKCIPSRIEEYNGEKVMDWYRVRTRSQYAQNSVMALHVPKNQRGYLFTGNNQKLGYNQQGMKHGKGDFILCTSVNGHPNMANRWVVNGLVFSNTYDNRGWIDCIEVGRMGLNNTAPQPLWKRRLVFKDVKQLLESLFVKCGFGLVAVTENTTLVSIVVKNDSKKVNFRCSVSDDNGHLIGKLELLQDVLFNNRFSSLDEFKIAIEQNVVYQKYYTNDALWNEIESELNKVGANVSTIYDFYINRNITRENWENFYFWLRAVRRFLSETNNSKHPILVEINEDTDANYYTLDISVFDIKNGDMSDLFLVFFEDDNSALVNVTVRVDEGTDADDDYYYADCEVNRLDFLKSMINYIKVKNNKDYSIEPKSRTTTFKLDIISTDHDVFVMHIDGKYFSCEGGGTTLDTWLWDAYHLLCEYKDYADFNWMNSIDLESIKRISIADFSLKCLNQLCKIFVSTAYTLKELEQYCISTCDKTLVIDYINDSTGYVYCTVTAPFPNFGCVISKSTLRCLYALTDTVLDETFDTFSFNIVNSNTGKRSGVDYKRMHYHDMVIVLGLFKYITEFKSIKLQVLDYNAKIFDNKIPGTLLVMLGNYSDGATFKSLEGNGGYCSADGTYIVFHGSFAKAQKDFTKYFKATILHEMCHAYIDVIYGSSREELGEDGGTLFGISEKYKNQWWCHGKKFDTAVRMAAAHTGFTRADIFHYSIGDLSSDVQNDRGTDRNFKTLSVHNAFDLGQPYRFLKAVNVSGTFCKSCGKINCSCNGEKIEIDDGRYIGVCKNCGKVHVYNDQTLESKTLSMDYLDVIDRFGLVVSLRCDCGGRLIPVLGEANKDTQQKLKNYMKDFAYAQRYVNNLVTVLNSNLGKYSSYFEKRMDCRIQITRDIMPVVAIDLLGDYFTEHYKFFVMCNNSQNLVGKLYRDYGIEYKGYLIHTFKLNTEKDMLDFLNYVMTYIRKDARTV